MSANLKPKKKELRDLMQKIVDEMGEEDSDSSSDDLPLQKIVPNAAWKVRAEEKQDDNMQDDSDNLEDMDSDSEDVREDLDNYRLEIDIINTHICDTYKNPAQAVIIEAKLML